MTCLYECRYYSHLGVHAPGCPTIVTPAVSGEAPAQVTTAGDVPLQVTSPATHLVPGTAVRLRLAGLCLIVLAAATPLVAGLVARVGGGS